jgi:Putative Ig domain
MAGTNDFGAGGVLTVSLRRGARRLTPLAIIVVLVLGTTDAALATPRHHRITNSGDDTATWAATEAPVPVDAWPENLSSWVTGVDCPDTGSCIAVGYYNNAANQGLGLIDTISDGSSALTKAPLPPHGHSGSLAQVTCSSVAFCVAIGSYDVSNSELGLIDILSDGTWSASEAPVPADVPRGPGVGDVLSTVDCAADGSCVVLGQADYYDPDLETFPFIDTLSDGEWTATDAPLPADAIADYQFDGPSALSCPTVGTCVAVGNYQSDVTGQTGLIDTMSDGTWTATAAPSPPITAAVQDFQLSAVSCPALGSCEALGTISTSSGGQYSVSGPTTSVIETLSDGTWTVMEAPVPSDASTLTTSQNNTLLESLACPAVGSCEALGQYTSTYAPGALLPFVDELSGGTWTPTTFPTGVYGLSSVLCPAVGSCVAVGQVQNRDAGSPVIETLSEGAWTATTAPVPANAGPATELGTYNGSLDAGSCATIEFCVALGNYATPSPPAVNGIGQAGLIETLGYGAIGDPTIVSPDHATFTARQSGSFTISATGGPVPSISETGKLPKGLHFNAGSGTATISGSPTSKKAHTYSLTITATNAGANEKTDQTFALTVTS